MRLSAPSTLTSCFAKSTIPIWNQVPSGPLWPEYLTKRVQRRKVAPFLIEPAFSCFFHISATRCRIFCDKTRRFVVLCALISAHRSLYSRVQWRQSNRGVQSEAQEQAQNVPVSLDLATSHQ